MLGMAPAAMNMGPATPQPPADYPVGATAVAVDRSARDVKLQVLRSLIARDKSGEMHHQLVMAHKRQYEKHGTAQMPADIASKRSWSASFKELEHRKRLIAFDIEDSLSEFGIYERGRRLISKWIGE